jgi:hypothetical protein
MATEADIDLFLQGATDLTDDTELEGVEQGTMSFQTSGSAGLPALTVQGGEKTDFSGIWPGTASLIEKRKKEKEGKEEREMVEGEVFTTKSGVDPKSGMPTLTAGTEKKLVPKGKSLIENILGTKGGIATFSVLESMGIPTRVLGATVRNQNPFASASDKGKTWDEVFADPESGIFKEARRVVRNSDAPGAVKFLLEMGISIPEDPLSIVGGLIGAGKSAFTRVAARSAAKKKTTDISRRFVSDPNKPDVLLPAATVDQRFTPAQKEYIETGSINPKTARKEEAAIDNAPAVKTELDAGRTQNIANSMLALREKHGFTNQNRTQLFDRAVEDVGTSIGRYRDELKQLYKPINEKADPTIIGAETKKVVADAFDEIGIKAAPKKLNPIEIQRESERLVREANKAGNLGIDGAGRPFRKDTGEYIDIKGVTNSIKEGRDKLALGANDLGMTEKAFKLLHNVRRSLDRDVPLRVLRKNKTAIQGQVQEARRAGHAGAVAALEKASQALNKAVRTQLDEVLGDKDLVDELLVADDFMTKNAAGIKAAEGLMYKNGKARTGTEIMAEFDKIPTPKKGRVIESMMDFYDEKGLQNLRNIYFNDIIKRASSGKDGFTGQKLRNVLNSQPEVTFNKVFTEEMKKDMGQLLADAISDDLGKMVTRSKLGTFTKTDKDGFIRTLFGNPAYRLVAMALGLTKASLKKMSIVGTIGLINTIIEKRTIVAAGKYLKATNKQGNLDLTFKAIADGAERGSRPPFMISPAINTTVRNLGNDSTEEADPEEADQEISAGIDEILQGSK